VPLAGENIIVFDDLSLEFKDDHLFLTHGSNVAPGRTASFWEKVRDECQNHDCTSILVESDSPTRHMDTMTAFTSGVAVASIAPNLRMALCFLRYEPDEISELFRQAAQNRGASIEFFSDRHAALVWLRADNPSF
jgi:hypothetical protein